jgi:hypothetical protein
MANMELMTRIVVEAYKNLFINRRPDSRQSTLIPKLNLDRLAWWQDGSTMSGAQRLCSEVKVDSSHGSSYSRKGAEVR